MYNKKIYRKRNYRRRRVAKKKVPSNKALAARIRKVEAKEELKYFDTYVSTASIDSATGAAYTNVMQRGTAINNRVGDVVYPTSCHWWLQIKTNPNNASTVQFRVMIFWDAQCNGAPPTLIGSPSGTTPPLLDLATITDPTFAPVCLQSRKRYKVIYDKVYSLTPNNVTASSITNNLSATATDTASTMNVLSKRVNIRKRLGRVIKYAANNGTYVDIVSNCLWLFMISDQASNAPTVEVATRLYYKDA